MNIQQGKQSLKEETLEDFIDSKRVKNTSVYFQTSADSKQYWDDREQLVKTFTNDAEKRKFYNENLGDLDPLYTNLKPLDGYVIRMSVREYVESKTGLVIVNPDMTQSIRPGSNTPGEAIRNPYDFDSVAVIVAVPEYEQKLRPGLFVQIVRPRPEVVADQVVNYEGGYAHPEYKLGELPKNVENRHFGYALVPYGRIKIIL